MKLYLAGRFSRREELSDYADTLRREGHQVKVRWLDDGFVRWHELDGTELTEAAENVAINNFEDVVKAEALLLFTQEETGTRAGYLVEFGLALGLNKDVFVIGPRTNVFCYYPTVEVFDSFADFLDQVL